MQFLTKHFRGEGFRLELGGGERITEQAGYIPPDRQIGAMMNAGKRLAQARREAYDYGDELPEELPVPSIGTYSDKTDLIDMSRKREKEKETRIAEYQAKKESATAPDPVVKPESETKPDE